MDLLGMLTLCGAFPVGLLAFLLWMARLEEGLPEAVRRTARRPDPPPILAIPVRAARVAEPIAAQPPAAEPTAPARTPAPTTPAGTPAPIAPTIADPVAPAPRIPAQRAHPPAEERPRKRPRKAGHTGAEV